LATAAAYLVRDGTAQQITKDQSLMQKLIEAARSRRRKPSRASGAISFLQALGPEAQIKVDLTHQKFGAAMCSSCARW